MIDDPMEKVDRFRLKKLVFERTPFSMGQFGSLVGWSFDHNDEAPRSKKRIAMKVLTLSKEEIAILYKWMGAFPTLHLTDETHIDEIARKTGQ